MSHYPPIQIVNEHDEPIGGAPMPEAYEKGLIHRIIYIFVEDEAANILLQKRSALVATSQNCWDISVAGHVDQGESYLVAAQRELHEELGLKGLKLQELKAFYRETDSNSFHLKRFIQVYKTQIAHDTPIHFPLEEISEIKWMTLASIKQLIKTQPDQVAYGLKECIEECY